ncbi:type VII secretion protein EccB [Glycomyces dulcitolivorans]|uniref:type VII secretion protein EccB n=1 Tax=Glycomyces dulcitolivorans TaxID=2200759 RepID=UPI000DD3C4C5|nr:type VII secretion protein EccB [Glycomyces dulcitolivorans]
MPQMRSRREQVDAHKFITSRMNQALVLANPDSIERPLRRIGLSIFVSVMVLALVFGGFAIATLFNKGNALPEPGNIITIKGSNSVYVYTTKSGGEPTPEDPLKLWPVANYTSALLLVKPGSEGTAPVQDLKPSSIAGIPRGPFTIGIQDVPTQPPDPKELLQHENWNTCSMPRTAGGTASFMLTQLILKDMAEPDVWLGDDHWLLAKTAVKEDEGEIPDYYLLWNGKKYKIGTDQESARGLINDLELNLDDAMALNDSMLQTITPGADIDPVPQEGFGEPSTVLDDENNPIAYGQPVKSGNSLYTLLKTPGGDEFAQISPTMELLLSAKYGATAVVDPTVRSEIGSDATYLPKDYPDANLSGEVWSVDSSQPAVCAVYDPDDQGTEETQLQIAMYEAAPKDLTDAAAAVEFTEGGEIFSNHDISAQTVLPEGTAALADSRSAQGATIEGFTYLISDQGVRHGLVDVGITDSTQQLLGYADVKPISVPDEMIGLIPPGNSLDPSEARKQMFIDADDAPVFETEESSAEAGG